MLTRIYVQERWGNAYSGRVVKKRKIHVTLCHNHTKNPLKMKTKLLLLLLLACLGVCYGQTQDGDAVLLQEVVLDSVPLSKTEIKDKTIEWIGKTFKSGESVITSSTENSLVGNYIETMYSGGVSFDWEHRITIDFKDNKARARIWVSRLVTGTIASAYWYGKYKPSKLHQRWLNEMTVNSKALINNYHQHLKKKQEDW